MAKSLVSHLQKNHNKWQSVNGKCILFCIVSLMNYYQASITGNTLLDSLMFKLLAIPLMSMLFVQLYYNKLAKNQNTLPIDFNALKV